MKSFDQDQSRNRYYGAGRDRQSSQRYGGDREQHHHEHHGDRDGDQEYGGYNRYGQDDMNYGGQGYGSGRDYGGQGQAMSRQGYGRETYGQGYGRGFEYSGGVSHRGKGPKGYQRDDSRIKEDICERLSDSEEIDASEIEVKVNGGEVTLEGSVSDRYMKRMAEDIIENVSGVKDVNNQMRVKRYAMGEAGLGGRTEQKKAS